MITTGQLFKGLAVKSDNVSILYFNHEKKSATGNKTVTAKEVQEAIKNGSVTPELLESEMERLETREQRYKVLDAAKIQKQIYDGYTEKLAANELTTELTTAELIASRLITYQSLDWQMKRKVDTMLFDKIDTYDPTVFYSALENLNEQQYAALIRMAILGKAESKIPENITALSFYKIAEATGYDVRAIEKAQQLIAEEREKKMKLSIEDLQKKINKLRS